ncbi:SLAP domain-containing protein [Lactobacillus helsingborgensis]|uniref:SLAP domain-containing protein n=1 Tax=Lactobacillus helsingborgensis TaxID=1218494 RepID=UPI0027415FE4|nr:SLAP domain-containing protein [Lactobacillus helsingborgensis]WLT00624.1 SLAP domain-containing protein [Lactobacillus helsingborgensis]
MKKNKRIIFATMVALSLAAPMTAVFNFDNVQTVSANHQGTKVWLQYGTLKYALKGPSGRIYPAGTRVVRELSDDSKPPISMHGRAFYLTLVIGGIPGNQLLQDVGGGEIAEAYVNYEDWHEIDYPADYTVLVQNTEDYNDLKSSDFHPVDSSNPDVPCANTDALEKAYADLTRIAGKSSVVGQDREKIYRFTDRYNAAKAMGATQESVDALTKEINDAVANYKKTGHLVSGNSNSGNSSSSSNSSNSNSGSTTVTAAKRKYKSRVVRLRKASYRYTHKGKRVSKKKLKKGAIVKINGKTYRIKKKTFYRIGKNRYIRKVNVAKY